MNIIINDKTCHAALGQTLSKAARINHSHVGYLCGGHGVCQTCQVIVLEGAECLSPVDDVEQAFLTPEQISAGYRMACRATIAREGTINVLSRPEMVRRTFLTDPLPLFGYGAEIGRGVASQLLPGIGNLAGRVLNGDIFNENELEDLKDSVEGLIGLTVETLPEYLPFKEQVLDALGKLPVELPVSIPVKLPPLQLPTGLPFLAKPTKKESGKAIPIKFTSKKNSTNQAGE